MPTIYGELKSAQTVLVCWGSLKGVCLEVLKEQKDIAVIHFTQTYPLDQKRLQALFNNAAKYVLVEQNSTSQLGQLLRQQAGINIEKSILRYDGRPMTASEIINQIC